MGINKMSIHIGSGDINFDIKNSSQSIYDQQGYNKKLLKIRFTFSADYKIYVCKYCMAINQLTTANMMCQLIRIQNSYFFILTTTIFTDRYNR